MILNAPKTAQEIAMPAPMRYESVALSSKKVFNISKKIQPKHKW